jgi:hypothetical protein
MIRWLIILMIAGGLAFAGSTVMLGNRTFFGHVRAIWATEEVQDMKKGIEEKAAPAVERVKRGVEAGLNEAGRAPTGSGSGSGSGSGIGSGFGSSQVAP